MKTEGVSKHKAGVRIDNVKYYSVNFDAERKTWYLKKVKKFKLFVNKIYFLLRVKEELVFA